MSRSRVQNDFESLLRSLEIRLITYDRPGWGRSDRKPGRDVSDSASDVAAIADALGISRFAIEGGSAGSAHALATAVLLGSRVLRAAVVCPMAPYAELGREEWTRGQDTEVVQYVEWCLEGQDRMSVEFAREDAQMREAAAADDPEQQATFEQTRSGIWGWVDDELAAFKPWGFDPAAIAVPTAIWYDPEEDVLPHQHAEWLAASIPNATVVTTVALGHRRLGDPRPDWSRLYSWLIESKN